MAQDTSDPFAFLRALAPAPGGDPADSVGGAAPATEAELFAGSEPVTPAPADPVPAMDASVPAPAAVQSVAPAAAGIASDEAAIFRAALVQLDARLQAVELIAKQNGWGI